MGSTVPLEWVDRVVAACAASGGICRRAFYIGTDIGKKRCVFEFLIMSHESTRGGAVVPVPNRLSIEFDSLETCSIFSA